MKPRAERLSFGVTPAEKACRGLDEIGRNNHLVCTIRGCATAGTGVVDGGDSSVAVIVSSYCLHMIAPKIIGKPTGDVSKRVAVNDLV